MKIKPETPYTIKGHIAASGFKSIFKHCYFIDGEWYRPIIAEQGEEGQYNRQPDEDEIGYNMTIFQDDYIIDSVEEEKDAKDKKSDERGSSTGV